MTPVHGDNMPVNSSSTRACKHPQLMGDLVTGLPVRLRREDTMSRIT